jgi:hypothetical protein
MPEDMGMEHLPIRQGVSLDDAPGVTHTETPAPCVEEDGLGRRLGRGELGAPGRQVGAQRLTRRLPDRDPPGFAALAHDREHPPVEVAPVEVEAAALADP